MTKQQMSADEMEALFDEGDMRYLEYFDLKKTTHPGLDQQKVSLSLPTQTIEALDREAERIGITRQAVIKTWIDEKLHSRSA
jgi:hypothetical protein